MTQNRSVLITGCSDGGIGAALALSFADHGFQVFATARNVNKMNLFTNRPNVTLLQLDVTRDDYISRAVQEVSSATGGTLDFLVNNAAHNHFMPLLDESIDEAKAIFETNVWGPLRVSKAFSPLIIKAKGAIINITSISGHLHVPWMGTYAASKRSQEIMAETLRLELQPFGVSVFSIVTGAVKSKGLTYFDDIKLPKDSIYKSIESTFYDFAHGSAVPKDAVLETSDFADKVVSSVLKTKTSGIIWGPGSMAQMNKFMTAWFPTWVLDSMFIKKTGLDEMMSRLT